MKKALLLFVLLAFQLATGVSWAQAPVPASPAVGTGVGQVAIVTISIRNNGSIMANFDTGGQPVGGLTEKALFVKFNRMSSAATILNFMVDNGYRVIGFAPTQARISASFGGGELDGYAVLLERRSAAGDAGPAPRN